MDLAGYVAIAHFHCKFERIHPFRDGNGRTGRSVLYSQMRELGASDIVISDRADYIERIKAANEGELAPLVKLLLGADSDFTFEMRSPFRMEPIGWEHPQASLNKDEAFRNSFL